MYDVYAALGSAGLDFMEYGPTAIDAYKGLKVTPVRFFLVQGSLIDLAKVFDGPAHSKRESSGITSSEFKVPGLEYPGLSYADAALSASPGSPFESRFLCVDSLLTRNIGTSEYMDFRRNPLSGVFKDPSDVYADLRSSRIELPNDDGENSLFEAAMLASRFPLSQEEAGRRYRIPLNITTLWQKDLLSLILTGPFPAQSFTLLDASGLVQRLWPELAALRTVDHAKEFHPEGGGWNHTMETFSHRKTFDLELSLALLLHDTGKPRSFSSEGKRFDRHAELGAAMSRRFLVSLGFDEKTVEDVYFLIRWHMMPAALPSLSVYRVRDTILDERFPMLLELFRCDEFSTFKGPDSYYSACAAYRTMIRNLRNPYRDEMGRKRKHAPHEVETKQ
jgi:poly(A) polymerase